MQGLEHLMYSLGLGHIEFEASHTIDEHHPTGYLKDNEELMKTYMEIQTIKLLPDDDDVHIAQDRSGKKSDEVATKHSNDDTTTEESKKTTENGILEFKEMHDPKHRHPRENGKI